MPKIQKVKNTNKGNMLFLVAFLVILGNILVLILANNEANTIKLLAKEVSSLEQDQKIITQAQSVYNQYQEEIDTISQVFPTEAEMPDVISKLEQMLKKNNNEYLFKFSSTTPLTEVNHLFLPINIVMKTDMQRLTQFLSDLENFPYMTHINSLTIRPGDNDAKEVNINLKIYVQNPFN